MAFQWLFLGHSLGLEQANLILKQRILDVDGQLDYAACQFANFKSSTYLNKITVTNLRRGLSLVYFNTEENPHC